MRRWVLQAVGLLIATNVRADPTGYGLGKTPQLGWNSWNQLGCNYDETKIRNVVDALVSTGLSAAGYDYLILDDCWMDKQRNTTNCPDGTTAPCWQFDLQRFPSGGAALIEYVHSKGKYVHKNMTTL